MVAAAVEPGTPMSKHAESLQGSENGNKSLGRMLLKKALQDEVDVPVSDGTDMDIDDSIEETNGKSLLRKTQELATSSQSCDVPSEPPKKQQRLDFFSTASESDLKESDVSSPITIDPPTPEEPQLTKRPSRRAGKEIASYNIKAMFKKTMHPEEWELASPVPSVTGYPLETPPPLKIKKKALWPNKKLVIARKPKSTSPVTLKSEGASEDISTRESSIEPDESVIADEAENSHENAERRYRSKLNTQDSDALTKISVSRLGTHKKLKSVPRKGFKEAQETMPVVHHKAHPQSTPELEDRMKKVKQSPKKHSRANAFGFGPTTEPELEIEPRTQQNANGEATKDNDDFCSACGHLGIFLCCEGCPRSFHFVCCDPPYDEGNLPEGSWYCRECLAKRRAPPKHNVGIFSKLMNQAEIRNPASYRLPKKIRELYEGVSSSKTGEYQDESFKPDKVVKQGRLEEADSDVLYDRQGNPLTCYRCKETGIHGKQIVQCEYCSLAWHLDCLDPPLATAKTLGTKWKCPNHVEDLVAPKRKMKKPDVVDVSMTRGFQNDGNVEIINTSLEESSSEDEVVDLPTPPYFDITTTKNGVSAPLSDQNYKILTSENVVYRIPEKGIILDFLDIAKTKKRHEIEQIEEQNRRLVPDLHGDSRDFIDGVSSLSKKPMGLKLDFDELVRVALGPGAVVSNNDEKNMLTQDEINDLLKIKKLIEFKGRDKMLEFLG
ncbi:unnamed protein product [Kuraishia capsulata CBS 1993]|uniref:PHD-type domain-containing protein n=1 Tax=Kuraishia capsulata CBS 1993 TaxID=1382522 RepID=W6MRD1_9ASCO|nr:uncharacterized protein KUCA_T00004908001 [Kuraishia capsulata CBS 1993]CDK28923.1 unnamed protein product [Kuraishia capsulata CBS 1993]